MIIKQNKFTSIPILWNASISSNTSFKKFDDYGKIKKCIQLLFRNVSLILINNL